MAVQAPGRALVVLIHGFLGGRIQFVPMASMLSSKYDLLNYGYRSRADTLEGHAETLLCTMEARMQAMSLSSNLGNSKTLISENDMRQVHFITHSFGGVVLHRAFKDGLADILKINQRETESRCVMLAPPLRGARFARAFQKDRIAGPNFFKTGLNSLAETIMGKECGAQLMWNESKWFKESLGTIPNLVKVLVISGDAGRLNPLIDENSDGVVSTSETMLNRPHFRKTVRMTHNLMLYSGDVRNSIYRFLDGEDVGELHH